MAHEHSGDCCGQYEHLEHEHMAHIAEQLGSMCCSGQCHHPEHQFIRDALEEQHRLSDDKELDEFGRKRKKKKYKTDVLKGMGLVEI